MCVPVNSKIIPKFKKVNKFDVVHEVGGVLKMFSQFDNFKFYSVSLRVERIDTSIGVSVIFVEFKKIVKVKDDEEMIEKLSELKMTIEKELDICLTVNFRKKGVSK